MADFIADSFKKYFTIGNTVLLVGILITQVRWQTQVDNRIQILEKHASDKVVHPTIESRINLFVPRVELDGRLKNIENALIEIKSDLKKNLEK